MAEAARINANIYGLRNAAHSGAVDVVRRFLDGGIDADATPTTIWPDVFKNQTALSLAAGRGHEPVVGILLGRGCRTDTEDRNLRTPLSHAAEHGHVAIVRLLLENGCRADSVDDCYRTPLSYAAERGETPVVSLLLERGCRADSVDQYQRTPLSYAAKSENEATFRLLLYADASPKLREEGLRPWEPEGRRDWGRFVAVETAKYEAAKKEEEMELVRATAFGDGYKISQTEDGSKPRKAIEYIGVSGKQIRLIGISSRAPLQFAMVHSDLSKSQRQPYRALSYTWGGTERNAEICLNGSPFPVTQNLWHALQRLQATDISGGFWWIDLVCINQDDISERSHQVSMMRDIFSNAEQVVAWLGTTESRALTRFMTTGQVVAQQLVRNQTWFSHYWSRVWIIQELMVAKNISLLSWEETMAWQHFVNDLRGDSKELGREIHLETNRSRDTVSRDTVSRDTVLGLSVSDRLTSNCRRLVDLWGKRDGEELRLSTLINFSGGAVATNARDRIYALLGLVNSGCGKDIQPDYARSACAVYCEAIRSMQKDSGQDLTLVSTHLRKLMHDPFAKGVANEDCGGEECGVWGFCKFFAIRADARKRLSLGRDGEKSC